MVLLAAWAERQHSGESGDHGSANDEYGGHCTEAQAELIKRRVGGPPSSGTAGASHRPNGRLRARIARRWLSRRADYRQWLRRLVKPIRLLESGPACPPRIIRFRLEQLFGIACVGTHRVLSLFSVLASS